MKNRFKFFLQILLTTLLMNNTSSAQDSSRIRISLLTCTPGEELYSIFGHSALRVIDSNSVTDHVFNYGTFDFSDEDFYLKFTRGKLLYFVSLDRTEDFIYNYVAEGRGITEQVLKLSADEKKEIKQALIENLKEENRFYKYDFFLDNCTTRLRDIILKHKHPSPILPAVMPADTRFRQAIHQYLEKGGQYWSELGIDILLGAPTDKIMTAAEQEFLPDNLMYALDSAQNTQIVQQKIAVFTVPEKDNTNIFLKPFVVFSVVLIFYLLLERLKYKFAEVFLSILDRLLFFATGFLGILLVLMWTATDHSMTKNNFNLLWAFPGFLICAFVAGSDKVFAKKLFLFHAVLMSITLAGWFIFPQEMNNGLLPIVVLLLYRSYRIFRK